MIRIGLAASLAVLINLLLFMLMSAMVRHSQLRLNTMEDIQLVDFVRPSEPEPTPPEHKRPPPEPPKPMEPRPLPRLQAAAPPRPTPLSMPLPKVDLAMELQLDQGPYIGDRLAPAAPAFISARELTALLTLPPRYPSAAKARRTEGFVEVEFTVTAEGETEDIDIIQAEPPGVFERATTQAVRRWRFQAHRVDGNPVAIRARQRVDFLLDK